MQNNWYEVTDDAKICRKFLHLTKPLTVTDWTVRLKRNVIISVHSWLLPSILALILHSPSLILHSPSLPLILHSPSLALILHSPSLPLILHSPSLALILHSPSLPLILHSPSLPLILHSPSLALILHSPSLTLVLNSPIRNIMSVSLCRDCCWLRPKRPFTIVNIYLFVQSTLGGGSITNKWVKLERVNKLACDC